jgi:hypothetical protein
MSAKHRYNVGDEVTTVTGIKAKVLELVPILDGWGKANYRVETEVGKAVWADDALK